MKTHVLSFARITLLSNSIAEVIIHDGIEMDVTMVREYHDFLLSHLDAPFSLLIDKKNSYTYTFEAQQIIASLEEIRAMAIISYRKATEISTQSLMSLPRSVEWNIKIFTNRDMALIWLKNEQAT